MLAILQLRASAQQGGPIGKCTYFSPPFALPDRLNLGAIAEAYGTPFWYALVSSIVLGPQAWQPKASV